MIFYKIVLGTFDIFLELWAFLILISNGNTGTVLSERQDHADESDERNSTRDGNKFIGNLIEKLKKMLN